MLIRSARVDEFAAVGELTESGYAAEGFLTLPDGGYDHGYATWLRDAAPRGKDGHLLVAVDDDDRSLLGTVTWCPPGSAFRDLASHEHQGEFRTLAVSPHARRRGIARQLVEECMRRGQESGLTEMLLCSLPAMTAAHALYASFGFARRPDLDWSPIPGVDLWGFSAPLPPRLADGRA